jgi:hypothetical protein
MAQQPLRDAMPGGHQIPPAGVVGAHQITRRLDRGQRDDHLGQRPREQQPGEQLGVLAVSLTRSDGPRGVFPGATTRISIPAAVAAR